jgi:hypothetical protein
MSGAANYDLPIEMTDAESLLITLDVVDDTDPNDYEYFYDLKGPKTLSLTVGSGIAVDGVAKTITINPGADYRLEAGRYEHGLLIVHKVSRQSQQLFDGCGTVTRSPNS